MRRRTGGLVGSVTQSRNHGLPVAAHPVEPSIVGSSRSPPPRGIGVPNGDAWIVLVAAVGTTGSAFVQGPTNTVVEGTGGP